MSKTSLHRIAAWHSFLAPLAGVGFFVLWSNVNLRDWVSDLGTPLLFLVFSSAFLLAVVTILASRDAVPRPVREIAWLGVVVSGLLLGMFILFLSCSRSSHPTMSLERMSGERVPWRAGRPEAPLIAQLCRYALA